MGYFKKTTVEKPTTRKPKKSFKMRVTNKQVREFAAKHESVTIAKVAKAFKVNGHAAYMHLERLTREGFLTKEHLGKRKVSYTLSTPSDKPVEQPTRKYRRHGNLSERVLQYVSDHIDETYTRTQMAEALDCDSGNLSRILSDFIRRGLVDKDFNKGNKESVAKSTATPQPALPKATNEITFCDTVETLIWEFVKETRSTDLLAFLTWLETKSK